MKRKSKPTLTFFAWLISVLGGVSPEPVAAVDYASVNATITQLQIWSGGSDQYGIRLLASTYPAGCGAFYIQHTNANKSFVYSAALTAYTRGQKVWLQKGADTQDLLVGGLTLCRLNEITLQ